MDIRVNQTTSSAPVEGTTPVQQDDGTFKFTLTSAIADASLEEKLNLLLNNISVQGQLIARHMDIRDMKKYRGLIRDFMNEDREPFPQIFEGEFPRPEGKTPGVRHHPAG